MIVEQLKQLSSAVERMTAVGSEENQKKIPGRFEEDSSAAVNAELQALRKQVDSLKDARSDHQINFFGLFFKVIILVISDKENALLFLKV